MPSGGSAYSATCQAITLWSRDLRPETKSVRIAHVVGQNYENIWGARQRWSRLQRWPGTPAHIWVTPLSRTPTLVDPIDRPSEYSQRILNARVCVADGVIHGQLPGSVATFPQAYHRLGPLYCGQFGILAIRKQGVRAQADRWPLAQRLRQCVFLDARRRSDGDGRFRFASGGGRGPRGWWLNMRP